MAADWFHARSQASTLSPHTIKPLRSEVPLSTYSPNTGNRWTFAGCRMRIWAISEYEPPSKLPKSASFFLRSWKAVDHHCGEVFCLWLKYRRINGRTNSHKYCDSDIDGHCLYCDADKNVLVLFAYITQPCVCVCVAVFCDRRLKQTTDVQRFP